MLNLTCSKFAVVSLLLCGWNKICASSSGAAPRFEFSWSEGLFSVSRCHGSFAEWLLGVPSVAGSTRITLKHDFTQVVQLPCVLVRGPPVIIKNVSSLQKCLGSENIFWVLDYREQKERVHLRISSRLIALNRQCQLALHINASLNYPRYESDAKKTRSIYEILARVLVVPEKTGLVSVEGLTSCFTMHLSLFIEGTI